MILVVGQENQNEPRGAFCASCNDFFIGLVWFFLNHELAYCLKVLITPEVQNKGSGLSYSHKCRCEGIEKWSELIFIFLGQ